MDEELLGWLTAMAGEFTDDDWRAHACREAVTALQISDAALREVRGGIAWNRDDLRAMVDAVLIRAE